MEEQFLNNFYLYFPDGLYRTLELQPKLCADLDEVLLAIKFDVPTYVLLKKEREQKFDRAVILSPGANSPPLPPETQQELQTLRTACVELTTKIDCLLVPVYEKMIHRGYSQDELCD